MTIFAPSCPEEVAWVAGLAKKHSFIKGIVGGLDLTQDEDELRKQIRELGDLLVRTQHFM